MARAVTDSNGDSGVLDLPAWVEQRGPDHPDIVAAQETKGGSRPTRGPDDHVVVDEQQVGCLDTVRPQVVHRSEIERTPVRTNDAREFLRQAPEPGVLTVRLMGNYDDVQRERKVRRA